MSAGVAAAEHELCCVHAEPRQNISQEEMRIEIDCDPSHTAHGASDEPQGEDALLQPHCVTTRKAIADASHALHLALGARLLAI